MMGTSRKGLKSFKKGMSEEEETVQRRLNDERTIDPRPATAAEPAPAERGPASEADRP
jgi:Sec-independent protein translocase protein TatA